MNSYIAYIFSSVVIIVLTLTSSVGADAPAGRYTVTAGTVFDTKTKLTWQRGVPPSTYTWSDAKAFCAGTTMDGTDWRLPTRNELLTIVDFSRTNPSIDPTAFPSTPSSMFWSSSRVAGSSTEVWAVDFNYGYSYSDMGDVSYTYDVRCVR